MKKRWILGIAALAAASAGVAAVAKSGASGPVPATVANVDLKRYAGKWHEQAHLPMYWQRKCVANTTAEYSLNDDGTVKVVNSCGTADKTRIQSVGVARMIDDNPSQLEVRFAPSALSFLPFVWGDYWIVDLDPEYQWSIVGSPNYKYLWILTREPQIPTTLFEELKTRAVQKGYDVSGLILTPQTK